MKRVALLGRVSTDRQKEEKTIESQIAEIEAWAKETGSVIVERYIDDGWSGDILARPELDRLRDDLSKDLWDAVVVIDRDRVARRYSYQELVTDEIREAGKEFIALHQAAAKTPEDRILQGFQGLFAEYEKVKIAERMRRGKIHKARSGKIVHGPAPYGYRYIPKTKDKSGYFEINEDEAKVVRMIFGWVADEGLTMRKVITQLYELGIPPQRSKRLTWTNGPLSRMLRNETYIGTTYYNKQEAVIPKKPRNNEKYRKIKKSSRAYRSKEEWIPIPVPKTIDEDLFYRTQEQLNKNRDILNMRNRKNEYLLVGFIYCTCGWRRIGEGVKERHLYYRCTERLHSFPQPRECHEGGVNARVLDKLVWEKLQLLLSQPTLIRRQAKRWLAGQEDRRTPDTGEMGRIENELKTLKQEEERYLKAYGSGAVSFDAFTSVSEGLKVNRNLLEKRLVELKKQGEISGRIHLSLDEICLRAKRVIKGLNFNEKRAIIEAVLDRVVANQQEATIKGFIPLVEGSYQNVGLRSSSRDCWHAECGKINIV